LKTRIKAVTLRNNSIVYYAQYKTFLFWNTVHDIGCFYDTPIEFKTLEEAKTCLDDLLAADEKAKKEEVDKRQHIIDTTPISHTFISHP